MNEEHDRCLRRVSVLGGRCRQQAIDMGLDEKDIVLVTTTIIAGQPPIYTLEKVDGNPLEWLEERFFGKGDA